MKSKVKFTIGSKWKSPGSGKVYAVIEKRPFGHIALKAIDCAIFLETYQRQVKDWKPVKD